MNKHSDIFAYGKIEKNFEVENQELIDNLDKLLKLSNKLSSPLLDRLKPTILLSIKWKFDYLTKTLLSPFNLNKDLSYWLEVFEMLSDLKDQSWFKTNLMNNEIDVWARTKDAFNFMWPKNTSGDNYNISKKMIKLRLEQIIDMIDGKSKYIENSILLDSGCGPGRYTDVLSEYNPKKIIGIDSGEVIIRENNKRFSNNSNIEMIHGSCDTLPIENKSIDFIVSAGVLHHLPNPIEELIEEHARVIKKNGYLFIFIAGKGGLELKIWEFMRDFLNTIPINALHEYFHGSINPLRLQGLLDHSYGEYQQTERKDLEKWLSNHFREIQRIPGIEGLDITEEIYANDIYFPYRFGTGNIRYLCRK